MSEISQEIDIEGNWEQLSAEFKGRVKGKRPINLEQQCLKICQQFLSGVWNKLSVDEIDVERLTSGMSSQTYYCKLSNSTTADENQTNDVVIRLYGINGRIDFKTLEMIDKKMDEGIISFMASETGVGPKIYGVFKTGQIMKYYPVFTFIWIVLI